MERNTHKKRKKEGKDIKREQVHTHNKDIERKKRKKGTDKESNIKQWRNTQHRFVCGISSVIFFSKSLSPSFSNLNFCLVMQIGVGFMGSS